MVWSRSPFSAVGILADGRCSPRGVRWHSAGHRSGPSLLIVSPAVGWEMPGCWKLAGKTPNSDPVDFEGHATADVYSWLGQLASKWKVSRKRTGPSRREGRD